MNGRRDLRLRGFVLVVLLVVAWEALAQARLISANAFPPMSRILATTVAELQRGELLGEIVHTVVRSGVGFGLAVVTMIALGVLIGISPRLQRVFGPIIEVLRPLPTPVIIPVAMLLLGVGHPTKVFVVLYACSFPVLLNTIDAVRAVHPMMLHTARSLKLTRWETLALVMLPAASPQILSGVRTSLALALLIGVVAEMIIGTDGIGRYIIQNQSSFRVPETYAGLLVLAITAYLVNQLYLVAEGRLLRWHYLSSGERQR